MLAYAFLKGKAYKDIEKSTYNPPDWKRVEALVSKYYVAEWPAQWALYQNNKITEEHYRYIGSEKHKKDILETFQKWKE